MQSKLGCYTRFWCCKFPRIFMSELNCFFVCGEDRNLLIANKEPSCSVALYIVHVLLDPIMLSLLKSFVAAIRSTSLIIEICFSNMETWMDRGPFIYLAHLCSSVSTNCFGTDRKKIHQTTIPSKHTTAIQDTDAPTMTSGFDFFAVISIEILEMIQPAKLPGNFTRQMILLSFFQNTQSQLENFPEETSQEAWCSKPYFRLGTNNLYLGSCR